MLAGPYAGMVLADLGAEVVKVEPLGSGEMTRGLLKNDPNYSFKNFGAYFLTLNRNKRIKDKTKKTTTQKHNNNKTIRYHKTLISIKKINKSIKENKTHLKYLR